MEFSDKREPMPLDYEPSSPKGRWAPRFNGWWLVLAMLPVFVFWFLPKTRSTDGFTVVPKYSAARWAAFAIGIRAAVGIIRRERTWVWVIYPPLYFLLPGVAKIATESAFRYGWIR